MPKKHPAPPAEPTITEIPLRHPPRTPRAPDAPKTLLELIEERTPALAAEADQKRRETDPPVINNATNTLFFTVPLCILLFWFDVLVHIQYQKEWRGELSGIVGRTLRGAPVIYAIQYYVHPRRERGLVRAALLAVAVAAGCYVVRCVNEYSYYYVMKRMPPVGTIWVWAVVEMGLVESVLSCALVLGYVWWGGYSIM